MSKKKVKKKEKKNENSFNDNLRKLTLIFLKEKLYATKDELTTEEAFTVSNILKEWYKDIKSEFVLDYVDYLSFCELLDYTMDLYSISDKIDKAKFNLYFKSIRNKLSVNLIEKKYQMEYFIAINRLCMIFDCNSMKPDNNIFAKVEPITSTMFLFALNVSTYIYKFQNKQISAFVEDKFNKVSIKYSKSQLFDDSELKNINYCYLSNSVNSTLLNSVDKVMKTINSPYEQFMYRDISNNFKKEKKIKKEVYRIPNKYEESPFFYNNKSLIDEKDLLKIPNDRLYITPSGGIKFEILNKSHNIDSIEMFEEKDKIYFNVNFINNGRIEVTNESANYFAGSLNLPIDHDIGGTPYTKKILKISCVLGKSVFDEEWVLKTVMDEIETIGCNILSTPAFSVSFAHTIICCIYLAYYEPFKFKNNIRMYNLTKNKDGGYSRSNGFRIAHLRKLPIGMKSSKEAKELAKKAGFNNIPEGYTFVSSSYGKDEEKRVRKIIVQ